VSLNILVTSFWYIYTYIHPVITKLNLKTPHSQTWEVVAVYSFMVEEAKQRYASSKQLKEVKKRVARARSIRNEEQKSNEEERPHAFGTPGKTHMCKNM
jgi:hypothetical protein